MDWKASISQCCIYIVWLVVFLKYEASVQAQLQQGFYDKTCPGVEEAVQAAVSNGVRSNHGTAAGLIRMHFHDCFVNGCDGSVLIDSTSGNEAEKDAPANNPSLHGFEVIDEAKKKLEADCPGIVSCADILAFAARDSVAALGGPSWEIKSGRRDGRISKSSDIASNIPAPTFSFQQLIQSFAAKGLSQDDMITLSGAHTVGVSHCSSFTNRLYSFNSTTPQDPSLDPQLATSLKAKCPNGNSNANSVVNMDPATPFFFDNIYYSNLHLGKALFASDQALLSNPTSATTVQTNSAHGFSWMFKFSQSMIKLSEVQVLTGQQGEIRKNCHAINV